jgi:hypothetical protein
MAAKGDPIAECVLALGPFDTMTPQNFSVLSSNTPSRPEEVRLTPLNTHRLLVNPQTIVASRLLAPFGA